MKENPLCRKCELNGSESAACKTMEMKMALLELGGILFAIKPQHPDCDAFVKISLRKRLFDRKR